MVLRILLGFHLVKRSISTTTSFQTSGMVDLRNNPRTSACDHGATIDHLTQVVEDFVVSVRTKLREAGSTLVAIACAVAAEAETASIQTSDQASLRALSTPSEFQMTMPMPVHIRKVGVTA